MKHLSDVVLCSIDFEGGHGVLIVGRQNLKTGGLDIVNAFQGEEAMELYAKLTTKPERTS